jgi:hypothetical protein
MNERKRERRKMCLKFTENWKIKKFVISKVPKRQRAQMVTRWQKKPVGVARWLGNGKNRGNLEENRKILIFC